jgi:hypothetical protein
LGGWPWTTTRQTHTTTKKKTQPQRRASHHLGEDGSTIVGDGDLSVGVHHHLVQTLGAQGGAQHIGNRPCSQDVRLPNVKLRFKRSSSSQAQKGRFEKPNNKNNTLWASIPLRRFCRSWSRTMINGRPYSSKVSCPDILEKWRSRAVSTNLMRWKEVSYSGSTSLQAMTANTHARGTHPISSR